MNKKQQTLFQSWNSKKQTNYAQQQTNQTQQDNAEVLFDDEDDELLRSALETTQEGNALPCFEELPGFDLEAGKTWIYPTNKPIRKYQRDIVETCLFQNTLVTLPTGLGKTFIAAVVMYNFFRWYPKGKIVFMAPTKPLVAQQIQACFEIMGIPREITCEMTGAMNPQERKKLWTEKRVFYLTPQVMTNDISRGACPASEIKCLVLDEAHKALGNYAYVQVVQELVKYRATFRILALSATPGSDMKAIQQVITNLLIARIELRSEESPDIVPYTHNRSLEKIVVPLGSDINSIKESFLEIFGTFARRLMSMNVLCAKDIGSLTKYAIIQSRERFRKNPPDSCPRSKFGIAEGDFAMCITLSHALELLTQHGIRAFYNFLFDKTDWEGENGTAHNRTRTELMKQPSFIKLMEQLKLKYGDNISRLHVSHPKLTKLEEIAVEHFKRCQSENMPTRVMIFSQYRDSVNEIVAILMEHSPLIKAMSFVGHGSSGGGAKGKGFTQADQLRVIKEFTEGNYNTLVSTCVGEEGLDIGDVDMIICYDMHKSPVRLVQRCGRTGRKRDGRVVMLMTEGREEHTFNQSVLQKKNLHTSIVSNPKLQSFLAKNQPLLIPKHLSPRCHEMPMQVVHIAQNSRPATKTSSGIGETTTRKVKTGKCYFLTDDETSYFADKFRHENATPALELNRWLPWQLTLQPYHHVGHSTASQSLVKLLKTIHSQHDDLQSPSRSFEDIACPVEEAPEPPPLNNSKATSDAFFELSWDDFDDKSFPKMESPPLQVNNTNIEGDNFFELSWDDFVDGSEDWQSDVNIKLASTSNRLLYDPGFQSVFISSPNTYHAVSIPSPRSFEFDLIDAHNLSYRPLEEKSHVAELSRLLSKYVKNVDPSLQSALNKWAPAHIKQELLSANLSEQNVTSIASKRQTFKPQPLVTPLRSNVKRSPGEIMFETNNEASPVISQRCLSSKRKLVLDTTSSIGNKAKRLKRDLFAHQEDELTAIIINDQNKDHLHRDTILERISAMNQTCSPSRHEASLLSVTEIIEHIESSPSHSENDNKNHAQFDLRCDFFNTETLLDMSSEDCYILPTPKKVEVKKEIITVEDNGRAFTPSLDFVDTPHSPILAGSSAEAKLSFTERLSHHEENQSKTNNSANGDKSNLEQSTDYKSIWDEAFTFDWDKEDREDADVMKQDKNESVRQKPKSSVRLSSKKSDITREVEEIFGSEESCVLLDEEPNIPERRTETMAGDSVFEAHIAAESDTESPIRIRKLSRHRNNLLATQSTPVQKAPMKTVLKDVAGRTHLSKDIRSSSNDKSKGRQFFDEEAELSLVDGSVSDDEEDFKEADGYDGSFIDDDANTLNVNETMHAVYLKSVKSPVNRGEFVFRPPAAPMNRSDIFSQAVVDDSDYLHDSFCVESDESDGPDRSCDSPELSALHASGGRKPRLARLKALNIKNRQAMIAAAAVGARSRKRIKYEDSSEEESETSLVSISPKKAVNSAKSSPVYPTKTERVVDENSSDSIIIASDSSTVKSHDDILSSSAFDSVKTIFLKRTESASSKTSSVSLFQTPSSTSGSGLKLFVSSRQVPVVGHIISTLRTKTNVSVEICSFDFADFVLSTRLGVLRKSQAEFANGSYRSRLQEQIRSLANCYDKPYLIVEADRAEAADSLNRRSSSSFDSATSIFKPNTPYFLQTVATLAKGDITVLHSDSPESTAQLLNDLCRHETLKGFHVPEGVIRNADQEMAFKFLQCIPEINPAVAFVMVANYKNLREILCSTTETLVQRCMISHAKAQNVYQAMRINRG